MGRTLLCFCNTKPMTSVTAFRIWESDQKSGFGINIFLKNLSSPLWIVSEMGMGLQKRLHEEQLHIRASRTTWDFGVRMVSDVEAIHNDLCQTDFFSKPKTPWMIPTKGHPHTHFTPFQRPGIYLMSANYLAGKAPLYIIYSVKRKKGAI